MIMEIIKDLPEVFEEFAEQRQEFLCPLTVLQREMISDAALHLMRRSQQQKRICHVTYAH